ncbi:Remorin family protein [Prunus dulcis]|uniref:Remorin family protein n=1 Tax=Prunus dulcis TaxID=3755 RepID=A0A4Y1QPX6_PRUDU|nr:Remorin family protein [Prunus dulcis]
MISSSSPHPWPRESHRAQTLHLRGLTLLFILTVHVSPPQTLDQLVTVSKDNLGIVDKSQMGPGSLAAAVLESSDFSGFLPGWFADRISTSVQLQTEKKEKEERKKERKKEEEDCVEHDFVEWSSGLVVIELSCVAHDKGCYNNHGPTQEISGSSAINFEFHKANGASRTPHHRTALGKPTPSKWDDAQKWLVGLSRGPDKNQSKTKPRNSNADDLRLIAPVPQKEQDYSSGEDDGVEDQQEEEEEENGCDGSARPNQYDVETKKVDCDDSVWRSNKPLENSTAAMRSLCLRDMGTEMTPIASQEPSRTATPIRATTPAARSPISSGSSTPVRPCQHGMQASQGYQKSTDGRSSHEAKSCGRGSGAAKRYVEESNACKSMPDNQNSDQARKPSPLETRAMAWDEAERAKYMARYKREEVRIQAWENHEKRKAEMEMRKMEVKAERMKARGQEKLTNKLAATRRIAEEKRANAEAKLNEKALRTSEKADYIRRTGHLPSTFSFKLPSLCW